MVPYIRFGIGCGRYINVNSSYTHTFFLFTQCIAAGSHIANHELESTELRPYAIQVSKMVTKVRQALREECFTNKTGVYPQKVMPTLVMEQ